MIKRITAIALAVVALLAISVGPASAHTYTQYQGSDYATVVHGYTCPTNGTPCGYRKITVVDKECDGNAVRAFYHLGSSVTYTAEDKDGCGGSAYSYAVPAGYSISSFRVCEATSSGYVCSAESYPQIHASV